jgi:hypothetical protein
MRTVTLNVTGVRNIGEAAEGVVGSWIIQVSGTFSGALKLRKKIRQGVVADAAAAPTYYTNFATGVSVAANTDITGAGLFLVPCYGCDLVLDYTHTSGACVVEAEPLLG